MYYRQKDLVQGEKRFVSLSFSASLSDSYLVVYQSQQTPAGESQLVNVQEFSKPVW